MPSLPVPQLTFYIFAAVLVYAALRVITSRNPVTAALHLVLAFVTTGCIWVLMQAEFLGIALVLIYVGAVMVLFLFVVMMLDIKLDRLREGFWKYLPVGLLVGLLMLIEMVLVVNGRYYRDEMIGAEPAMQFVGDTQTLARTLFTEAVFPFELASLILTVGMVAAVALPLRRRKGPKYSDPARQVKVKAADRLRIISMPAEVEESAPMPQADAATGEGK